MTRPFVSVALTCLLVWQASACAPGGASTDVDDSSSQLSVPTGMCDSAIEHICQLADAACDPQRLDLARQACEQALFPIGMMVMTTGAVSFATLVATAAAQTIGGLAALAAAAAPYAVAILLVAVIAYVVVWYATHWEEAEQLFPFIARNALISSHPVVAASYLLYQLLQEDIQASAAALAHGLVHVANMLHEQGVISPETLATAKDVATSVEIWRSPGSGSDPDPEEPHGVPPLLVPLIIGAVAVVIERVVNLIRQQQAQPEWSTLGRVFTREVVQIAPWVRPLQEMPEEPDDPSCVRKIRNELLNPRLTEYERGGPGTYFLLCKDDDHRDLFITPVRVRVPVFLVMDVNPEDWYVPSEEALERLEQGEPLTRVTTTHMYNLSEHTVIDLEVLGQPVSIFNTNVPGSVDTVSDSTTALYPASSLQNADGEFLKAKTSVWFEVPGPWRSQRMEWTLRFTARQSGAWAMGYLNWNGARIGDWEGDLARP